MKVFLLLLLLLMAGPLMAAPFLVCDPYPASSNADFRLQIDGGAWVDIAATVNTDGTRYLHYDLTAIAAGAHTVSIKAWNSWGESTATPFTFTRPAGSLAAPTNVKISLP